MQDVDAIVATEREIGSLLYTYQVLEKCGPNHRRGLHGRTVQSSRCLDLARRRGLVFTGLLRSALVQKVENMCY